MISQLEQPTPQRLARNLALAHELATILKRFRARGISSVPLRGPALAEQLYGDSTARPCGDLDLLVRKPELAQVKAALHELGYRLCDRRQGFAQAFSYTWEFFKTEPVPIIVEPHWTLVYPPFAARLDMDPVWSRCRPARFLGLDTLRLNPADLLLNLCAHLVHHGEAAPRVWVRDLDQLIRKEPDLQWDVFAETARQAGVGWLAAQALERARARYQTPIPAEVIEHLTAADGTRSLASAVVEHASIAGKESFAVFFALKGVRKRWRYAWALLAPSPEFMRVHYGLSSRWQVGVWYVRRVVQLGTDAVRGCWQTLSGSSRRRWS